MVFPFSRYSFNGDREIVLVFGGSNYKVGVLDQVVENFIGFNDINIVGVP